MTAPQPALLPPLDPNVVDDADACRHRRAEYVRLVLAQGGVARLRTRLDRAEPRLVRDQHERYGEGAA